ncbi:MAG: hypothetical protein KAI06_05650 [Anaerolineales bacterium]|nr:hypothetical protein [Anaerolineales bacterium]
MGLLGTLGGLWFGPQGPNKTFILVAAVIGLLLFIALITFKSVPGWNVGLLTALGLALGVFMRALAADMRISLWLLSAVLAGLLLALAATFGRRMGFRMREVGIGLWLLSWAYLLGWALIMFLGSDTVFTAAWAGAGVLIFSGLAAAWFAVLEPRLETQSGAELGVDLFFLFLNLTVAMRVLFGGFI